MFVGVPGIENIDFGCSRNRKYGFLVLQKQEILIFGVPSVVNINFWCSGDRKY